jgi:hypothetical protein
MMGQTTKAYRIWFGMLLEKVHLEDRERDGKITQRWILGIQAVRVAGAGLCSMAGFSISGVESQGSATHSVSQCLSLRLLHLVDGISNPIATLQTTGRQ